MDIYLYTRKYAYMHISHIHKFILKIFSPAIKKLYKLYLFSIQYHKSSYSAQKNKELIQSLNQSIKYCEESWLANLVCVRKRMPVLV